MAVRHRLIRVSPDEVWDVLADGNRYAEWVVGTSESHPINGQWPKTGAAIGFEVPLGPVRLSNETVVRRCEEGVGLELEAHAGVLGTARIAIELRPWGEHCLVIVDEHPLRGAGGMLHNVGFEALIQLRHRAMLARLARLVEAESRPTARSLSAVPSADGAGSA
ncbi:SRPBCC family protein [Streptomyces sp. GXMU-J15]|uniref:SRPBCC family protein n=1 Tax=Streptomyces fuscus TaxID=3048495 RepID=A0ABT7J5R1_9ACTN|nr:MULTISPECIES: SRPBCC family protein [Streptomyces]MDL2079721.1 SRPBCC family protein [Streptomyces fuscus]SBT93779.1 Polyketide cyclase / dehydrase and lipid transport [Streptomyces sp. DI166]